MPMRAWKDPSRRCRMLGVQPTASIQNARKSQCHQIDQTDFTASCNVAKTMVYNRHELKQELFTHMKNVWRMAFETMRKTVVSK